EIAARTQPRSPMCRVCLASSSFRVSVGWCSTQGAGDCQPVVTGEPALARRVVAPQECGDARVFATGEAVGGKQTIQAGGGEAAAIRFTAPCNKAGDPASAL